MKSKVTIFSALAFLLGACSTGTYVTDRYDDIYFTPGDVPPPVVVQNATIRSTDRTSNTPVMIMSEQDQNDGGTLKNYILETDRPSADAHYYDMEGMELIGSDTTVYENDREINYVINNYYDADDLDFSYRINRFHRYPYYSSYYWNRYYYDPFYYPYYSWGYYDPWYYDYWYGPSFGFGFGIGWYSPWYYSSWGYPHYGHYHGGYYGGGYYGGGYYGIRNNDVRVGRRSTPSYDYSGTALGSGSTRSVSRSATTGTVSSTGVSRQVSGAQSATLMERRRTTADTEVSSTGRRSISTTGTGLNQGTAVGQTPSVRSTTVTGAENSAVRRATTPVSTGTYQNRSTTTTQQKEYTPSYSKPRTVTRSTYNSSSNSSGSSYSRPASSSSTGVTPNSSSGTNTRSTYRSSSSYSQGSSSKNTQTYSPPSNSSTSRPSSSYSPSSSGSRSSGSYSSGSVSSGSRSTSSGSSSSGSSSSGSSSRSSGGSSGGRR